MRRFSKTPRAELAALKRLDSPSKIQDFLDGMPINHERGRETCRSPLSTLKRGQAHCLEGALLAASALWYHGKPPLLLNLKTTKDDVEHAVALFKENGCWGAISKTNHAVLRYRDPVYASVRELAMSYFNEYFLDTGKKTLRAYSEPFDLTAFGDEWLVSKRNLWDIGRKLMLSKHVAIVDAKAARRLRRTHPIEIKAGKIKEWKSAGRQD